MDFQSLGLDGALCEAIKNAFQIETPSDIQIKSLQNLSSYENSDVLVRSKTGSGKTLAFLLPILHHLLVSMRASGAKAGDKRLLGTKVLVIVPTRELASQTQTMLEKLLAKLKGTDHWICSGTLSGGDRRKSEKERLRKGLHIVVATPGRLLDHLQNTEKWTLQTRETCEWIVMDEADRLLDVGFAKFMKDIFEKIIAKERKQKFILCSATVNESVKDVFGVELRSPLLIASDEASKKKKSDVADKKNKMEQTETVETGAQLEHFYFCTPTRMRLAVLAGFLEEAFSSAATLPQKVVIFSICCDTVDFIAAALKEPSLKLLPTNAKLFKLHGNLEHKVRMDTFKAFTQETSTDGSHSVLICTDVAARGLNLTKVTTIIQYDAPCDMTDYIHRAGRTARQQDRGKSIIFLMPSERDYIAEFQKRNVEIKSLKWEALVQRIANRVKSVTAGDDNEDEEESAETASAMDVDTRRKILKWMHDLQDLIKPNATLTQLAKNAFLSYVRAYATHPASEKAIFHIKKLHLGHLAATFLLSEPPKHIAANQSSKATAAAKNDDKGKWKGRPTNGNSNDAPIRKPPKRMVSEFDAGDVGASYLQPRKGNSTGAKKKKIK